MSPLFFLFGVFVVFYLINRFLLRRRWTLSLVGRATMAAVLLVAGVGHFVYTDVMVSMMPDLLPAKAFLVYFTGVIEFLAVGGIMVERTAKLTSLLLILFFLCVLPANISGALKHIPYGGMEGGSAYLWFRIPLQLLFIAWVYYFGVHRTGNVRKPR